MASSINLEDLPQLVLEKITSLLNHKQLLALEQVSRKLKCAVDAHFATTDHLIIGSLPPKDEKCLNGFLTVIRRCGVRLRTIQISIAYLSYCHAFHPNSIENYYAYLKHFIASAEGSNHCPNVEKIIVSPYTSISHYSTEFLHQNALLKYGDAEIYASNVKLSTGERCKLRSIRLSNWEQGQNYPYQRILDLYSNIEQMSVLCLSETFCKFLPQFVENGLKDLSICCVDADYRIVKELFNICKDLRTLRLDLRVRDDDDIAALNQLQMRKNVELKIVIWDVDDCFVHLTESVCNSVISCNVDRSTDYNLMTKFKNLEEFNITKSEILQVIAKGWFPKMRNFIVSRNLCNCNFIIANPCDLQTFLPQVLISKGNQLTVIDIHRVCRKAMKFIWKALRHCKAARLVQFGVLDDDSPFIATYEDMEAISHLPNLQHFILWIVQRNGEHDAWGLIRRLMECVVKKNKDFQFDYKLQLNPYWPQQMSSLNRINL